MAINIDGIDYSEYIERYDPNLNPNTKVYSDNSNVPVVSYNSNFVYTTINMRIVALPKSAGAGVPDYDKLMALVGSAFNFQDTTHSLYSTAKSFIMIGNIRHGVFRQSDDTYFIDFTMINQEAL